MPKKSAKSKNHILIANGVNLDLLGLREQSIYGLKDLKSLEIFLQKAHKDLSAMLGFETSLSFFQSNCEAEFLEKISEPWAGLVINPGAWTHTSLALADRLKALALPYAEVHLSHLANREEFRQKSYTAGAALGVVYGFGFDSYHLGLLAVVQHLKKLASNLK